ncbi:MAG: site-2 protease family protein, partial [Candidatus Omnitrophica bacterium]|nr:site-2 protease family protein [Candidatus Omnitrophota bacterium]
FLMAVVVHECAHGWVAYRCGDPTAKMSGRLTLNPFAHIDPMGTILFPLLLIVLHSPFVFGWARPVPVNFFNLRHHKRDMVIVGIAGPASNILIAIIGTIVIRLMSIPAWTVGGLVLEFIVIINLLLAVFNLVPVPPLDGSRVVSGLLPKEYAAYYNKLEPFGIFILIGLLALGLIDKIILPIVSFLSSLLLGGGII